MLRVFAILCYATPVFFAGLLLKLVFSIWLGLLPVAGRASTGAELDLQLLPGKTGIYLDRRDPPGDPAVIVDVLAARGAAGLALGLLTARHLPAPRPHQRHRHARHRVRRRGPLARGERVPAGAQARLPARADPDHHRHRAADRPAAGGAVLTETTFEWKGLGFQLAEYLKARDFVAVQGIVALLAVIVAFTNFVVDILAALIDPRVRY